MDSPAWTLLRDRIVDTINESEQATRFQDLQRLERQARRLKWATAALALLLIGTGSLTYFAIQSKAMAQRQARAAREALEFVSDLIAQQDPDVAVMQPKPPGEVLKHALNTVLGADYQPHVKARVLQAIGAAYVGRSEVDAALDAVERAGALAKGVVLTPVEQYRLSLSSGEAYLYGEKLEEAKPHLETALALARQMDGGKPSVERSAALVALGDLRLEDDDGLAEAEKLYQEALQIDEELSNAAGSARDYDRLGYVAHYAGKVSQARDLFENAISKADPMVGAADPVLLAQYEQNFAGILYETGDFQAAEQRYEKARVHFLEAYGTDGHDVAIVENNLARVLLERDQLTRSRPLLEDALRIYRKRYGERYREMAMPSNSLGLSKFAQGDYAGARKDFDFAQSIAKETGQRIDVQALVHISETYLAENDLDAAARHLAEAHNRYENYEISSGWRYAIYESALGELEARSCNDSVATKLLDHSAAEFANRWPSFDNLFKRAAARRSVLLTKVCQAR
jgi:tetratricopeptide (TPR) repeat protein